MIPLWIYTHIRLLSLLAESAMEDVNHARWNFPVLIKVFSWDSSLMAESEFRVLVDIAPVQALSENITLHIWKYHLTMIGRSPGMEGGSNIHLWSSFGFFPRIIANRRVGRSHLFVLESCTPGFALHHRRWTRVFSNKDATCGSLE